MRGGAELDRHLSQCGERNTLPCTHSVEVNCLGILFDPGLGFLGATYSGSNNCMERVFGSGARAFGGKIATGNTADYHELYG